MKLILLLIVFTFPLIAQEITSSKILEQIKAKLDLVEDYSVNAEISIDLDFIRAPRAKAKIFFKKPDMFKIESESFALLPKQEMEFNPVKLLTKKLKSEFLRDTAISGVNYKRIKLSTEADTLKFDQVVLYIDYNKLLISKLILTATDKGNITNEFFYNDLIQYSLPSEVKIDLAITFEDFSSSTADNRNRRRPDRVNGTISIKYSDYIVNKGLDDSLFEEKKKE